MRSAPRHTKRCRKKDAGIRVAGRKAADPEAIAVIAFDETKKKDNPWDIWLDQWAADWPSGAAILPVLFDGRTIKAENNSNTSYVNNDTINAEFDRVLALPVAAAIPTVADIWLKDESPDIAGNA